MANFRHCLRFPSLLGFLDFLLPNLQDSSGVPGLLLSRQVSLYLRPDLHLFAPRLFDAIGLFTVEELVETEKARLIVVGFLSLPSVSDFPRTH